MRLILKDLGYAIRWSIIPGIFMAALALAFQYDTKTVLQNLVFWSALVLVFRGLPMVGIEAFRRYAAARLGKTFA